MLKEDRQFRTRYAYFLLFKNASCVDSVKAWFQNLKKVRIYIIDTIMQIKQEKLTFAYALNSNRLKNIA